MAIAKQINSILHCLMIRYVMIQYYKKSIGVQRKYPKLFLSVDKCLSKKHRALWSRLGIRSGDRWLRLHVNLTGIQDHTFCPEDIFFARIERILNDCNASGMGVEDKNELFRYVPENSTPETVFRYVRGAFYDKNSKWISLEEVISILTDMKEDIVGKPCRSSG